MGWYPLSSSIVCVFVVSPNSLIKESHKIMAVLSVQYWETIRHSRVEDTSQLSQGCCKTNYSVSCSNMILDFSDCFAEVKFRWHENPWLCNTNQRNWILKMAWAGQVLWYEIQLTYMPFFVLIWTFWSHLGVIGKNLAQECHSDRSRDYCFLVRSFSECAHKDELKYKWMCSTYISDQRLTSEARHPGTVQLTLMTRGIFWLSCHHIWSL